MIIRKAKWEDRFSLLELSNLYRSISLDQRIITPEEHEEWLKKALEDDNIIILVAVEDNKIAGQIKYYLNHEEAIVSISLFPEYIGQKIGEFLYMSSLKYLKAKSIKKAIAWIKDDNLRSIYFFNKMNFVEINKGFTSYINYIGE